MVWHITWSVNSVTHVWGYRNYETPDVSRNNALIALLSSGEGWHNNHHADSRSARHGHEWWEIDLTWLAIRLLMVLGLAKNVAVPSPILAAKFNSDGPRLAPGEPAASDNDVSLAPIWRRSIRKTRRRPRKNDVPLIGFRPIDAPPNSRDSPGHCFFHL